MDEMIFLDISGNEIARKKIFGEVGFQMMANKIILDGVAYTPQEWIGEVVEINYPGLKDVHKWQWKVILA